MSAQPDETDQDRFVQNTDTAPTADDGPQDIDQDPVEELTVGETDGETNGGGNDDGGTDPVPE